MPDHILHHGDITVVVFVLKQGPTRRAFCLRNYQLTDTYPGDDDSLSLATAIFSQTAPYWNRCLVGNSVLETVYVKRIRPTMGDFASYSTTVAPVTRFPGQHYPPQIAFLVRLIGVTPTNIRKGRMYWPFVPSQAIGTTGIIHPGYAVRADTLAQELVLAMDTTGWGGNGLHLPGLFHRASLNFTPIDSWELAPFWATQRRRWDGNQPYGLPY